MENNKKLDKSITIEYYCIKQLVQSYKINKGNDSEFPFRYLIVYMLEKTYILHVHIKT